MKDPAFLFYYQDWLVGTYFLNRREKGAYMDLLCYQADKGVLTLQTIKEILNGDFECWQKLKEKFIEEGGIFYNKRLRFEKEKRDKFNDSRRNNRTKKDTNICKTYETHKENENENENENVIEDKIAFEVFWNLYGKKVDRRKCEGKWNRLTKAEQETCIKKLPEYIVATPDIQFRRNPETYLNNKSWENEIIKPEKQLVDGYR